MLNTDPDALVCDLMETYHIDDWRKYPVVFIATLAYGLHDNSRIKLALSGQKQPVDVLLGAAILDRLTTLVWMQTEDGHKGRKRPASVVAELMGDKQQNTTYKKFLSPEEFEKARAEILAR